MTPRTIKALDYWCGLPLCLLVTAWAKLWSGRAARRAAQAPRRILFLKLTEQGAVVLAYPAARRAAERVGRENVFVCVFAEHRHMPALLDVVPPENIITIRQTNLVVFAWDVLKLCRAARRLGIDAVVDLEFFSRTSALIAYLSGARLRVGYHRFTSEYPNRGNLMTHRVQYNPYLHTATAYLLLVDALWRATGEVPLPKTSRPAGPLPLPRFRPDEGQRARVLALLGSESSRAPEPPFLLLNPNAGDMLPLRKWAAERFVALAGTLLATYDRATIVMTGLASERDAVARMVQAIDSPRVVNLAGRTDLSELLTLYSLADVLVTNDSGPGHFASLTDVPCVVLFGPETPQLFAPLGDHVHVIYEALACSPCVNVFNHRFSPCRDNVCMAAITVDRVARAVHDALSRRPRG